MYLDDAHYIVFKNLSLTCILYAVFEFTQINAMFDVFLLLAVHNITSVITSVNTIYRLIRYFLAVPPISY